MEDAHMQKTAVNNAEPPHEYERRLKEAQYAFNRDKDEALGRLHTTLQVIHSHGGHEDTLAAIELLKPLAVKVLSSSPR